MSSPDNVSLSGMTDGEAREFHKAFISGFVGFTIIAIIAHLLVWFWRPWIPGEGNTYSSLTDAVQTASATLMPFIG
ncbi:MAG: light-harvesting antenna LH1, beta subunit [Pseudomonadota bacterium]